MSLQIDRLLKTEMIPKHLWDAELTSSVGTGTVTVTPTIAAAYESLIDRSNLRGLAASGSDAESPVGGLSQEETDKHFAQRFDNSSARAQFALLNPLGAMTRASNALIRSLSGKRVVLTDVPCGAGAASLSLLAVIAELRQHNVLPREPLDVYLIGGELSASARAYAAALLEEIRPSLESQAINVIAEWSAWNVTDMLSNRDLIRRITIAAGQAGKHLLIVANFSGFLKTSGNQKQAWPQLSELFRYCSGEGRYAIWIEPDTNAAVNATGILQWARRGLDILRVAAQKVRRVFAREDVEAGLPPDTNTTCSAAFRLVLNPSKTVRLGLALMAIDLTEQQ